MNDRITTLTLRAAYDEPECEPAASPPTASQTSTGLSPHDCSDNPPEYDRRRHLTMRLLSANPEDVGDDELIELLLMMALPHMDVSNITDELLSRYKTLSGLLKTPILKLDDISELDTITAAFRMAQIMAIRATRQALDNRQIFKNLNTLARYLNERMGSRPERQFHTLYLNERGRLIEEVIQGPGTIGHIYVYEREIISVALKNFASGIVIASNQESGTLGPSESERDIFARVGAACKLIGLDLHDYLLISSGAYYSMEKRQPFFIF